MADLNCTVPGTELAGLADGSDEFFTNEKLEVSRFDAHPNERAHAIAAEAIEKAGGKALPIVCDVRSEAQVYAAVEQAVHTFGGIDVADSRARCGGCTGRGSGIPE